MKTSILPLLAGLVAGGADDDVVPALDAGAGEAPVAASWTLALGGEPTDCFVLSATHVRLTFTPVGGAPVVAELACEAGQGTSPPLRLGTYQLLAELVNFDGDLVASLPVQSVAIDVVDEPLALSLPFDLPAARVSILWDLQHPDGSTASCEEFDANRVELTLHNELTGAGFGRVYDCASAGSGEGPPVPLGEYSVVIGLLTDFDVLTTATEPFPVSLANEDEIVALEPVTFVTAPR